MYRKLLLAALAVQVVLAELNNEELIALAASNIIANSNQDGIILSAPTPLPYTPATYQYSEIPIYVNNAVIDSLSSTSTTDTVTSFSETGFAYTPTLSSVPSYYSPVIPVASALQPSISTQSCLYPTSAPLSSTTSAVSSESLQIIPNTNIPSLIGLIIPECETKVSETALLQSLADTIKLLAASETIQNTRNPKPYITSYAEPVGSISLNQSPNVAVDTIVQSSANTISEIVAPVTINSVVYETVAAPITENIATTYDNAFSLGVPNIPMQQFWDRSVYNSYISIPVTIC